VDAVEVIHMLGKQKAIFHAHMKDTTFYKAMWTDMAC